MAKTTDKGMENREIVLGILTEVLEKGSFIHLVLNQALYKYQYLDKADRAFITRTAEGTLEYMLQIDAVLNRYSKVKTGKMKPFIRNLLRMSVYQLLYMDRVPDSAVCNEAVKLAVKHHFQGLKGFVNGVLRTISREKESIVFDEPSLQYSIPSWIYDMWKKDYGEETAGTVCSFFLKDTPVHVRCNVSRAPKEEILSSLREQGVTAEPVEGAKDMLSLKNYDFLESLEAFQKGWIQVQDVSSAFVGEAAAPKEGSYILDVCAAPGGKSLQLADKLKGTGMVEARDINEYKTGLIEENIARCNLSNIRTQVWDALEYDEESEKKADIVIADLPCSGLGIMGKKPDIKYHITPEKLDSLAKLQREILSVVWHYVKPGGLLIYSTCTINSQENEENAKWFAKNFPFRPVDLSKRLSGARKDASLKEGWIQFLPGIDPFDGFFISAFERVEEETAKE